MKCFVLRCHKTFVHSNMEFVKIFLYIFIPGGSYEPTVSALRAQGSDSHPDAAFNQIPSPHRPAPEVHTG